ncbi:hypothetical protein Tco_0140994, partial [Tanacetum coccineum]
INDESIGSSVSYIILSDSEADDTTLPVVLAPPLPDYVQASPNYVLPLDIKTEPFEAPASADYAPGSDIETEPLEEDPHEADLEESLEEDPFEEDPS